MGGGCLTQQTKSDSAVRSRSECGLFGTARSLDRNATRATLGFGGKSKDLSMGLSPIPRAQVCARLHCLPGQSDFSSKWGLVAITFSCKTFHRHPKLNCLLTYPSPCFMTPPYFGSMRSVDFIILTKSLLPFPVK